MLDQIRKIWIPYKRSSNPEPLSDQYMSEGAGYVFNILGDAWVTDFLIAQREADLVHPLKLIDPRELFILGHNLFNLQKVLSDTDFNSIIHKLKLGLKSVKSSQQHGGHNLVSAFSEIELMAIFSINNLGKISSEKKTGVTTSAPKDADFYLDDLDIYVEVKTPNTFSHSVHRTFAQKSKAILNNPQNIGTYHELNRSDNWSVTVKPYNQNGASAGMMVNGKIIGNILKNLIKDAEKKFASEQDAILVIDGILPSDLTNALIASDTYLRTNPNSPISSFILKTKRNWGHSGDTWKSQIHILGRAGEGTLNLLNKIEWRSETVGIKD